MIFSSRVADVIGAVREPPPALDPAAAQEEAPAWATEMGHGRIVWERLDDQMAIGRIPGHAVVVRSILLPLGRPETEIP